MKKIKATLVVVIVLIAVIIVPLGIISPIAAESVLTQVTLRDDGIQEDFLVGAETVGEFFFEAGIFVGENDRVSHPDYALLWDGMEIFIDRAFEFFVRTDGGELLTRVARSGLTVADVQRQVQQETDTALIFREVAPLRGEVHRERYGRVNAGDVLNFDTWYTRYEVEFISLPYETIENFSSAVSQGRQNLRVVGESGEKAITTAVVYIGGDETSRQLVSEEILSEPIDAILDIGTGWLGSLTDVTRADFHYYHRVRMEATAYTQYYGCTGKHPCDPWFGITASGRRVEHGIVAVDRNVIPLGTRLYVENYGFAIAADVGGAIRGYKIDLFMYTIEEALQFGRRHIYVWILDPIWED